MGFETADRLTMGNSQSPQNFQSSDSSDDEYHLAEIEDILNYNFKDKSLLKEAMTHASSNNAKSYERLEFLGDSILGFLVSKHICCSYPDYDQYKLTILRSQNVDTEKLARVCVKHEFHKHLDHKSPGFEENIEEFVKDIADNSKSFRCGDLKPIKVLADIVESLAGAVFLDNGYSADKVWEVFRPLLEPLVIPETLKLHPVTELQELCQKKGKYPEYEHWRIGNIETAQVLIDGKVVGIGENQRKDLARRVAAKNALDELKKEEDKIQMSSKDDKQSRSHEQVLIAKRDLNDFCAKKHWISPDYKFESEEGPPHMKKFVYSVSVETKNGWTDNFVGNPMPTKNMAKDSAAKALLDFLGKNNYD